MHLQKESLVYCGRRRPEKRALKIQISRVPFHQSSAKKAGGGVTDFDIFVRDLISSPFIFYQKLPGLPNAPPPTSPSSALCTIHHQI